VVMFYFYDQTSFRSDSSLVRWNDLETIDVDNVLGLLNQDAKRADMVIWVFHLWFHYTRANGTNVFFFGFDYEMSTA
jgi:hypothetical protein